MATTASKLRPVHGGDERTGSAGPDGPGRFRLRPVQVVGAVLVVGLVGSLLAFALVASSDDEATSSTTTTIPRPTAPVSIEAALRPEDPTSGTVRYEVPGGWLLVTPTAEGVDSFVEERAGVGGAGPVVQLVERLRPAILGEDTDALGPIPFDPNEADRAAASVAVDPDGRGYVLVSSVPARGAQIGQVEEAVRADLGTTGVSYAGGTVGGQDAIVVTVDGGTERQPAEVVHHLVVVSDLLVVFTATGSAPTDLIQTVAFDVPAPPSAQEVVVGLHPDHPDAEATLTVPAGWVTPPVAAEGLEEFVATLGSEGDDALVHFLQGVQQSLASAADAPSTAIAPRFLAADPYGRSYLLVSTADIGAATLEQVRAAYEESQPAITWEPVDDLLDGRAGLVGTETDDRGVETTTRLVLAGPILVNVVTAGPGADEVADGAAFTAVPPVPDEAVPDSVPVPDQPDVPLPTTPLPPTTTAPSPPSTSTTVPVEQRVVRIPLGDVTLTLPFPDGWEQVPTDPDGYSVFQAQQAAAGRGGLAATLERIRSYLVFDIPELPFGLTFEVPEAAYIGVAGDGSQFIGVQLADAQGSTAAELAVDAVAAARVEGRDLTSTPLIIGGERVFRLREERAGFVIEQDVIVVDDVVITLLHGDGLSDDFVDGIDIA